MLYVLRSDGVYVSFEGLTQQQIIDMLATQGLTCTFIDQQTFDIQIQNTLGG